MDTLDRIRETNEQRTAREQKEAEQRHLDNEAAKASWQRKLADDRAVEAAKTERDLDAKLAPWKAEEKARWLAQNIERTEADFEQKAWPNLRPVLVTRWREDLVGRTRDEMRRSGAYSL